LQLGAGPQRVLLWCAVDPGAAETG
jgi:hypothetical protein